METKLTAENLFKEYRKVDTRQKDDLILRFAPLIKLIVNRIALRLPSHVDSEDLTNAGVIGLMDVVFLYIFSFFLSIFPFHVLIANTPLLFFCFLVLIYIFP